eukprot:PITA_05707
MRLNKECNELRLRSRRIITPEENGDHSSIELETPPVHIPSTIIDTKIKQGEDIDQHKDLEKLIVTSPPFPKRLTIPKPILYLDFDLVGELKSLCVKTPLLQAIQDIPIYAKMIKELCVKKPVRKAKYSPNIHVVGTLFDLLLGGETLVKYEDLKPTTTLLELADRSVVRPKGTLQDIIVFVYSWEYPIDCLVINPKIRLDGHPLILVRPWLVTTDAYIGCQEGNMTIGKGDAVKNLVLYSPAKPSFPIVKIGKQPPVYLDEIIFSPHTVAEALEFKDITKDDVINNFIIQPANVNNLRCQILKAIIDNEALEDSLKDINDQHNQTTIVHNSKPVEIEPGKVLNINDRLDSNQQQKLIQVLEKYKGAFACDYPNMKGVDP